MCVSNILATNAYRVPAGGMGEELDGDGDGDGDGDRGGEGGGRQGVVAGYSFYGGEEIHGAPSALATLQLPIRKHIQKLPAKTQKSVRGSPL